ncbi:MAG: serine protease AprX, partial [Cyclobacteriaceae bacterium]
MSWIKITVFLLFLGNVLCLSSQDKNRFFVYFSSKSDTPFDVSQPSQFLSEKSIERRQKQGISITDQDLPVDPVYVSSLRNRGIEVFHTSKWFNGAIIQVDSSQISIVTSFDFVDSVAFIAKGERLGGQQADYEMPSSFAPSPGAVTSSIRQSEVLDVPRMHEQGYTGDGMTIAVLDGGFIGGDAFEPFAHVFINGHFLEGKDLVTGSNDPFQYSGHGTAVWSTIGALSDSLTGIAFDANFLLYVTEDVQTEYRIEEYNWLIAAEKADSAGADIITSSVGYSTFNDDSMDYSYELLDGQTAIITQAANLAFSKGLLVVTSAGNEGNNSWQFVTAPADSPNVLAVGSVDRQLNKSSFSSLGPTVDGRIKPDVMAIGTQTALMAGNGIIQPSNGTSYSAPQIAGLAAGVWQANPDWTNRQVMNALQLTASRALAPNNGYGYGIPTFRKAVEGGVLSINDLLKDEITVYPNPFRDNKIYIDLSDFQLKEGLMLQLFDTRGSLVHQQE